jgi:hypothetical protein
MPMLEGNLGHIVETTGRIKGEERFTKEDNDWINGDAERYYIY